MSRTANWLRAVRRGQGRCHDGKALQGRLFRKKHLAVLFAVAVAHPAFGHGGVAMEKDVCKLSLGPYLMHFTGYLPEKSRGEFCEDIPIAGRTVVVLDFLDDVVRDQRLAFKIVRDDGTDPVAAPPLFDAAPKTYPSGSAAFRFTIPGPGRYVGVARLSGAGDYVSVFPFSVGQARMWHHLLLAGGALLTFGALVLAWAVKRRSIAISSATA